MSASILKYETRDPFCCDPGPPGVLSVIVEGDKHTGRWVRNYVIHTYLTFTIDRPRDEVQ